MGTSGATARMSLTPSMWSRWACEQDRLQRELVFDDGAGQVSRGSAGIDGDGDLRLLTDDQVCVFPETSTGEGSDVQGDIKP